MKFQKGQSGNPGGRPKKPATKTLEAVEALARKYAPEAIERLYHWSQAEDGRVSVAASQAILDRALGKPRQALEHSGADGSPLVIRWQPES